MKKSTKIMFGVVLVCLLAGGGAYAYLHSKKDTKLNSTTAETRTTVQQPATNATTTPEQTVKPANQFDIPELGIRMTLPVGLSGLKYEIDTALVQGVSFAKFTTARLQDREGTSSKCTSQDAPLGTIWFSSESPIDSKASVNAYKQLDTKYLLYQSSQSGCSSDSGTTALQMSQSQLLKEAISTAVYAQN
jgi:predicted ribosomally synthesized peptide with SipW-like signal peptide